MSGRKKHPNEYNLTRWIVARIEANLTPEDRQWLKNNQPRFWRERSRYRSGKIAIMWRRPGSLARKLGEQFSWVPATFQGPLGQILMGKKLELRAIQSAIAKLGSPYAEILLAEKDTLVAGTVQGTRPLDDIFLRLEHYPNLATVEALVYLFAWADHDQNHGTWNAASRYYHWMVPEFKHHKILPFNSALFDAIDCYARYRNFHANARHEHRLSWRQGLEEVSQIRERIATDRGSWIHLPRARKSSA